GLTAQLTPFLTSIAARPERLSGGRRATVTVELSAEAGNGGFAVDISSDDPALAVPSRVFIPQGQRSVTIDVATAEVDTETVVHVAGEAGGIRRETTITLEPLRQPVALAFGTRLVTPYTTMSGNGEFYSLYTPELNLLAETDLSLSPALAYEYVWFAGLPVAQFDIATTTTRWTFTDHLGTPIVQTDAAAAVAWRAEYEPFGPVFTLRTGATLHQPLRFPGQEAEGERSYNIFRWYRGGWGRYTQADPLFSNPLRSRRTLVPSDGTVTIRASVGSPSIPRSLLREDELSSGTEVYGYAGNSPLMYKDPLGLMRCLVFALYYMADYRPSGPPGATFRGCLYNGLCGGDSLHYVEYRLNRTPTYDARGNPTCQCPKFCTFLADDATARPIGRVTCFNWDHPEQPPLGPSLP
ncbi:MAG TPA: RHS domain-containing protein, partial [Thermoanaerobaculia bacterium]|nr:RHS domain-containing protein [Thermoanaerobaculia bacterium]